MKYILKTPENFLDLISSLKKDDILFCSDMTNLAQNTVELKKRIDLILSKQASIYFQLENMEFSNTKTPEQEEMYHFLEVFFQFELKNNQKRRQKGIQKAKEEGHYSKERRKKIPFDLREVMLKEKENGLSVVQIVKKYHISRKTFYNYTQGATKSILKNIETILTTELMKKQKRGG